MYILGISALYHDATAILVRDREIIVATQEERFTRIKYDMSMLVKYTGKDIYFRTYAYSQNV